MEGLLTVDELAARLKVDKSWLYSRTRIRGHGGIPHIKLGKYIRFRADEVMTWLQDQQSKGMSP